MTFHLMFVHNTFSLVLVAEWPPSGKELPLGLPRVLIVFGQFVILVISSFGFEGGVWFVIAPVPVYGLLATFI